MLEVLTVGLFLLLIGQSLIFRAYVKDTTAERKSLQRMAFAESKSERIAAVLPEREGAAHAVPAVRTPRRPEGL